MRKEFSLDSVETLAGAPSLADRVKQDLRDIYDYILVNFYSQQVVDGKVDLLLSALETLELFPEACPYWYQSRGYGEMKRMMENPIVICQ